jgi:hypothetical protein
LESAHLEDQKGMVFNINKFVRKWGMDEMKVMAATGCVLAILKFRLFYQRIGQLSMWDNYYYYYYYYYNILQLGFHPVAVVKI